MSVYIKKKEISLALIMESGKIARSVGFAFRSIEGYPSILFVALYLYLT